MTSQPARPLAHPLFWSALAVLLINDRWLKHAHLIPGSVTGKLSDFAGLIVAPVLLAALVRARGNVSRAMAFACVAAVFAAIKLSRTCADGVEALAAWAHVPSRIWTDSTDLLALSMLPVAWWLSSRTIPARLSARLSSCVQACGLILGIFACAATSSSGHCYVGTAFLFNGTAKVQNVRVYGLKTALDCSRTIDSPASWPGPDAFVLRSCQSVEPRGVVMLDQGSRESRVCYPFSDSFTAVASDAGIAEPTCDAVLIEAPGLQSVLVTWSGLSPMEFNFTETFGGEANDAHGLVLESAGSRLFIASTSLLRVLPAGFEPTPANCPMGER